MKHPDPRPRRGAHRTRRDLADAVIPSLLAVVAVVAVVVALYVWQGGDADPERTAGSRAPVASAAAATASPTTASQTTTAPPPTEESPTDEPSAEQPSAEQPSAKASETAATPTSLEVVVLNQTTRSGLAAGVASDLRARGFDVAGTGNFRGIVPATTVYYPDGERAAAMQVAKALPTPPRLRPRFSNLSTTRLTIVLTDSYPST